MTDHSSIISTKEKPRICAIDLEQEIVEALQAKGLQCYSGTLGSQVKVPNLGRQTTHSCLLNFDFPPNLHEYDIIIVDLHKKEPIEYIDSEHTHQSFKGSEQTVLLSSYPETIFDPRPLSSNILKRELQDFFSHETLVIVFCSAQEIVEYHPMKITRSGTYTDYAVRHSLYEFIPLLPSISNKIGENVIVSDIGEDLRSLLQKYSKDFFYEIVFQHPGEWKQDERKYIERNDFVPLLLNLDNEIIGFIDFHLTNSAILAFPQLQNKKNFLLELVDEQLPKLFSNIFPYSEQFSWLKSEEYLLPNQAALLFWQEKRN
ncbi:hypothetical protein LEP3755_47020 [Leptolyngbya sp. NIES-3755]|nr:hypothetical protein LEP3755_47020 [Leptolyngbya sp. NIES-3755]